MLVNKSDVPWKSKANATGTSCHALAPALSGGHMRVDIHIHKRRPKPFSYLV